MNIEEKCKSEKFSPDFEEEESDEEIYSLVEQVNNSIAPKSALFPELKRCHRNNLLRESLIGFKDGIPGTFSGYRENAVRSSIRASIREKQPFFGGEDKDDKENYCLVTEIPNFNDKSDDLEGNLEVNLEVDFEDGKSEEDNEEKEKSKMEDVKGTHNHDEELSDDDDEYTYDLSAHFNKPRYSIKDQHVLIANIGSSFRVESGMRYFDPRNNCPRKASSSFLVPLSNEEENLSDMSGESDTEILIEKSDEFVPADEDIYEAIGTPRTSLKGDSIPENVFCPEVPLHAESKKSASNSSMEHIYSNVNYDYVRPCVSTNSPKVPRLPPRNSIVYYSEDDKETYFEVELKEQENSVQLPPLQSDAAEYQRKRYQLIKCIMEKEHLYMKSLRRLVKEYEEPILENGIVDKECVKSIFKHVHEIMQCHQLFNMALSYRANEWEDNEVIGDVILASFSKAMVFKAYCNFVCSFSVTMDSIKETCKSVPAFFNFLKNKEYDRKARQSLYYLMCQPLQYISDLVILTETLLTETPFPHADRKPLQMALTHLECLCETLATERMNIIMKERVKVLDAQCIGLENELATSTAHFIRYDDMLLCETENGNLVKTKPHRIFLLDNYIVCASFLSKRQQMQLMTNKVYKVKWSFPIMDVCIVDVTSGIYINTDMMSGCDENYQVFKGQHPSKYMDDLLHDLTMVGDIMGKVSSLRLAHPFIDSNKVTEWYKEIHRKLDNAMETANMNWIEISVPSTTYKGKRDEWLFNVPSPRMKFEWSNEFENINLRMSVDNNPGWYLQEENIYEHEVVNLQRALPLVASVQPLFMINADTSVICVLDLIATSSTNKPILWIFSGNDKVGVITLMEMKVPSTLNVLHSYIACNERICAAEIILKGEDPPKMEKRPYVWVGTLSGRILIYDALDVNERQPMMSVVLEDSIVSMKYTDDMVFVGLANGNLLRFDLDVGPTWDLSNPTVLSLSLNPVMSIVISCDRLWCASGSAIFVVDVDTMLVEEEVAACENRKGTIKQMIAYGIGVWVSMRKSSILILYHGETKEQLQMINTTTPIQRMKEELEGPIRDICIDNIYVTGILAKEGMLWVAVDKGLIVTYPLPKLGGIPIVSGKACVSFHAHNDSVKHLHAFSVQRSFQPEEENYFQTVKRDNSSIESPSGTTLLPNSKNVIKSKMKNGENGLDPEYFVLEYDQQQEVAPRTNSLSSSDDSIKTKDNTIKHSYMNVNNETKIEEQSEISYDVSIDELYFTEGDFTRTPIKKATVVANTDDSLLKNGSLQVENDPSPSNSLNETDVIASMLEHFKGFDETPTTFASENEMDGLYDTPEKEGESVVLEKGSDVDTTSKAEIPITYPTKRRHKRLSAVRTININETSVINNDISTTDDSTKDIEKDLPASFFVQGESFSAYDVNSKPTWETFVEDDGHIYEVPLKVCQEFYTTLDGKNTRTASTDVKTIENDVRIIPTPSNGTSNQPKTSTIIDRRKTIKMSDKPPSTSSLPGMRRLKSENESWNNSLPTNGVTKLDSKNTPRNSLLTSARIDSFDSTDYIPPLSRKYESAKGSDIPSSGEDGGDVVNNSWYVLSIGSGHLDLRQYTRYSEYVNLSNPPTYDGKEALLLLWKLNAGKHLYR